ncbi:MAG: hypothetical protein H7Y03_09940 [Chitinophagaceae bacterium]|nr:hypothetical protein [Chitinophagaceae bacterium]
MNYHYACSTHYCALFRHCPAQNEVTATEVIWKDFGYENNYSTPHLEDYKEIGPFSFDRMAYTRILKTIISRKFINNPCIMLFLSIMLRIGVERILSKPF